MLANPHTMLFPIRISLLPLFPLYHHQSIHSFEDGARATLTLCLHIQLGHVVESSQAETADVESLSLTDDRSQAR